MRRRIKEHPISTTIGIAILIVALYQVLFTGMSWLEFTIPLAISFGCLYAKDTLISKLISKL